MISKVFHRSNGTIGVKSIAGVVKAQFNVVINHKREARLMGELNLQSKIRKKRSNNLLAEYTVDAIVPNLLQRDFDASFPNMKWVADLTEFNYFNTKFYGCAILDLFDRQVVGFRLSLNPDAYLVTDTLQAAVRSRDVDTLEGLVIHTDQGSVFRSREFRRHSQELKFTQSMSRKANCWDNAVIESFFSHLKTEFPFHSSMDGLDQIEKDLHKYIAYYNNVRGQKRLQYLSPNMYYQQFLKNQIV